MAETETNHKQISVTHVNVRVSIVFLLLKLVLLDVIAAFFAMVFFGIVSFGGFSEEFRLLIASENILYFSILALLKIALTIFLVVQWLNEYYEITPNRIHYRRGIIWRKETAYELKNVRSVGISQGLFGRVFSYGTLFFYNRAVYKYYYLNDIHNPGRYLSVLRQLLPETDIEKETIREHVRDEDMEHDLYKKQK